MIKKGFVAIDDLSVHDGPCLRVNLCSFENNDTCGYENDPSGLSTFFDWKIGTGKELRENYQIEMVDVGFNKFLKKNFFV